MYSVSNIPLDNPTFGWRLMAPTKTIAELQNDRPDVPMTGRDGVAAGIPSSYLAPVIPFVVSTPRGNAETLIALFTGAGAFLAMTTSPTRSIAFEFMSHTYDAYGPAEEIVNVTFLLRLPGVFWRDTTLETSAPVTVAASVNMTVFAGMSAPVGDALVRVDGATSVLRVTDTSGAWLGLSSSAAGEHVLIAPNLALAKLVAAGSWDITTGTDVSDRLDFGGPRGVFEITPFFTDPATRVGKLTITATTYSAATVTIRGKGAHVA